VVSGRGYLRLHRAVGHPDSLAFRNLFGYVRGHDSRRHRGQPVHRLPGVVRAALGLRKRRYRPATRIVGSAAVARLAGFLRGAAGARGAVLLVPRGGNGRSLPPAGTTAVPIRGAAACLSARRLIARGEEANHDPTGEAPHSSPPGSQAEPGASSYTSNSLSWEASLGVTRGTGGGSNRRKGSAESRGGGKKGTGARADAPAPSRIQRIPSSGRGRRGSRASRTSCTST
jgi:hypothetical protein